MKKLLALLLVSSMLSSFILIAWATDDFEQVDNTRKTVTEEVYEVPNDIELTVPEEIEQQGDGDVTAEKPEDTEIILVEEAVPASEVGEQTDIIIENTVIVETKHQPLVTTPSAITIKEGSYSIGGENIDFNTSIIQPFSSEFNINPNNGGFSSAPAILINTGSTALILKANSCISIGENTPKVVRVDKFQNWLSLGRKDTASNIALGIQIRSADGLEVCKYWFDDESSQRSEVVCVIQPEARISIQLIAKHGMSWVGYHTFQYRCLLEFETLPIQVKVQVETL